MLIKLAIIISHPIQYYVPLFQQLHKSENFELKVFYTWGEKSLNKYDPGFSRNVEWDIPLFEDYDFEWAVNTATDAGTHHFNGIITPWLEEQLINWNPAALLIFGWAFRSHLQIIRKFKNKIPIYFRGDSTLLDDSKSTHQLARSIILKWVYRQVDHVFYVGTNNKNYFLRFGLRIDQMSYSPHSIDNDRFPSQPDYTGKLLRIDLGINDQEIVILFAGKLEEKKSPKLLLQAFLNLERTGVHLLFVGSGSLKLDLQQKAGSHKTIHFLDFVNQSSMPSIYRACDIFCLPSQGPGETWGLAVNEAMASGKAILVSDKVGCAIDLVKTNVNGDIFESGNLHDLESKLLYLLHSKAMLQTYGRSSAQIIKSWNIFETAETIERQIVADFSKKN